MFPSLFGLRETEGLHFTRKKRSNKTHAEQPVGATNNSTINSAKDTEYVNLKRYDSMVSEEGSLNSSSSNNLSNTRKLAYFMSSNKHSTALQGHMEPQIAAVSMGSIIHSLNLPSVSDILMQFYRFVCE